MMEMISPLAYQLMISYKITDVAKYAEMLSHICKYIIVSLFRYIVIPLGFSLFYIKGKK